VGRIGTTEPAEEKGSIVGEIDGRHTSGAKALLGWLATLPGINPRPTQEASFSAHGEVVSFTKVLAMGTLIQIASLVAAVCLSACTARAQLAQPDGGAIERGTLPERWLSQQPKCMEIPEWEVHEYNKDFYILRQSPCSDFEKPFVFLLFGKEKALLMDTGSRNGNLAPALKRTVKNWLARNGKSSIPLIVAHTHEHEDHTWGDKELQAMNDPAMPVEFVAAEVGAVQRVFGIAKWPTDIGHVDLGGRMIDVIPIPGHSKVSVALYDRNTAVLLTGDTLYPGRLYVVDFAAYEASVERLIQFTEGKPVAQVIGNHIEQSSTPFVDYPVGTMYQPQEHALALSRGTLLELGEAVRSMHGVARRLCMRDFSVWPVGPEFMTADEEARFKGREKEQRAKMWDQRQ
jgi:glyoxylase-like metal-dependent hydrolase (beta-lactamase superfamily II)